MHTRNIIITLLFAVTALFAEPLPPRYAPDRPADVLHLALDVTPDFAKRTISGVATLRFKPVAKPLHELRLDAVGLEVLGVTSSEPGVAHHVTPDAIVVTFPQPVPTDREAWVAIKYKAEPREGLYFRTPALGYPEGDDHLWTQGEAHMARHWFPGFDYPNERFTTEVTCRVPPEMTVVSNGRLVSQETDAATGLKAVRWLQDKPHVNYLVALAAGKFAKIEARHGDVPLAFYTPASRIEHAKNSFRETAEMIAFFERELGTAYPWDKYDQVVVDDFMMGGMENTSITILTDRTLHPLEFEPVRSSRSLVAHELSHQWFGDLLTCSDWSHLWLNEGFATYYALLYEEHKSGRDEMLYGLYLDAKQIFDRTRDKPPLPIVTREYRDAMDQFDHRAYDKGSWVLHMLRTRLGEDLYRRCIQEYVKRHAFRSVESQDLQAVFEELSGLSLQKFFDQWLHRPGHPRLRVEQSWDEKTKLAKVTVRQLQDREFSFPVTLRFTTDAGAVEREVTVDQKEQDFYVALASTPRLVRFDAKFGLLAEVEFERPAEMLYEQLKDAADVVGRLNAVEALKKHRSARTVEALKAALNGDAFHGVRSASAVALREMQSDESFEALTSSTDQPDPRVRRALAEQIGQCIRAQTPEHLHRILASEKHPEVLAAAIAGLGRHAGQEQRIRDYLAVPSYRNTLAVAAVGAMRTADDPAFAGPLLAWLQSGPALSSRDMGEALETLGRVARHLDDKSAVRLYLTGLLTHKKLPVQLGAFKGLGALRDPRAIAAVEPFHIPGRDTDEDSVSYAAAQALKSLRDEGKTPAELSALREEVTRLKEDGEKLRKVVEDLQKRLEAR